MVVLKSERTGAQQHSMMMTIVRLQSGTGYGLAHGLRSNSDCKLRDWSLCSIVLASRLHVNDISVNECAPLQRLRKIALCQLVCKLVPIYLAANACLREHAFVKRDAACLLLLMLLASSPASKHGDIEHSERTEHCGHVNRFSTV